MTHSYIQPSVLQTEQAKFFTVLFWTCSTLPVRDTEESKTGNGAQVYSQQYQEQGNNYFHLCSVYFITAQLIGLLSILHTDFGQRSLLAGDIPKNIMEKKIQPKKMKILWTKNFSVDSSMQCMTITTAPIYVQIQCCTWCTAANLFYIVYVSILVPYL